NMHGLLATTSFSGPVIVVNGPIAAEIGMNSGVNCLGQGNRANATIGRALQLVVKNVGGGKPGGIDRATFGGPGKYSFCFAEDESGSPWGTPAVPRGFPPRVSTASLHARHRPAADTAHNPRTPRPTGRNPPAQPAAAPR